MYINEIKGKGGIEVKMVCDSIANNTRIATMQLRFHRFILPEFNTHRMFSKNASSSRAIPVKKMLEQVKKEPAMPIHWGANQPGMQAEKECDSVIMTNLFNQARYDVEGRENLSNKQFWFKCAEYSAYMSEDMSEADYHKQIVNRITEPYQFVNVIVTATEWDNFFNLRLHKDAQPEIHELARCMKESMDKSKPSRLNENEWHLPYVPKYDEEGNPSYYDDALDVLKCSVARCARVSYLNHDNSTPNIQKDIALYDMLLKAGHMSPFEHQATPMPINQKYSADYIDYINNLRLTNGVTHIDKDLNFWSGNFRNWVQHRQIL